jgi:hypothetical protein
MSAQVIKALACRHGGGASGSRASSTVASVVLLERHLEGDGAACGSVAGRQPSGRGLRHPPGDPQPDADPARFGHVSAVADTASYDPSLTDNTDSVGVTVSP